MRYRTIPGPGSPLLLLPAFLVAFLTGCGYVGEPLPPLANVPARVTGLAAVQRGGRIVVQFSVPQLTTEGVVIKQPVKLDLRIGTSGPAFDAGQWAAGARQVAEVRTQNGAVRYEVPAAEWAGQDALIAVRVVGANGKDAGWSNFAAVLVVPPPETPVDLRAEATPAGIRLTWKAAGGSFRVFRSTGDGAFSRAADVPLSEWVDGTAEFGRAYAYLVQAIVKAGDAEAESESSTVVRITPEDRFPPAVPANLRAVVSTASVELAWDESREPDFTVYRVYRSVNGGAPEKISETGTPSWSDHGAGHGLSYRYAVSAVDKSGNESGRSETVEATVP